MRTRRSTQLEANQHLQERGLQARTSRIKAGFALLPTLDHVTAEVSEASFRVWWRTKRCEERFTPGSVSGSLRESADSCRPSRREKWLTTCWTRPLARVRSPRPVNVSVSARKTNGLSNGYGATATCRLYCGSDPTASTSMRTIAESHRTFTSSETMRPRSSAESGSLPTWQGIRRREMNRLQHMVEAHHERLLRS